MTIIGELDQLLTFQAESLAADGYGGGDLTWVQQAQAWAKVQPVSARESERQGAERAGTVYVIEVWQDGLAAVTEACRILWHATAYNDLVLNIREIRRPPSRTMKMTIIAETGVTV